MKPFLSRRPTNGFTLAEVLIVSTLSTFLAMLLAAVWSGLGRPLVDAAYRVRIAQEANLAAAALARDLGGTWTDGQGRLGAVANGTLVGRMQPADSSLRLCFDGGAVPNGLADWDDPDTIINYHLDGANLVRWDERAGTTFVAARNVESVAFTDQGNGVEIKLTISYRNITRTYTLIAIDP